MFRASAHGVVRACVRLGISADAVSLSSIAAAALAAACFYFAARWPWLLFIAPAFCYLRLWLNMLDGMVAIAGKTASRRGEIMNELPDRISDILIFAGVAGSGLCHPALAYWAAIGAVMTAYVGVTGQAVADVREYGGFMSKPWRMVVLHLAAWTTLLLPLAIPSLGATRLSVFDIACIVVIAGCVQTCVVRTRATLRRLS